MPRCKKDWGRQMKRKYPPRIDATPEELVQAMSNTPHDTVLEER